MIAEQRLAGLAARTVPSPRIASTGIQLDDYPFLAAVDAGELAYRTWHVAGPVGDDVADGRVGYVPVRASAVPRVLREWRVDATLSG